MASADDVTDPNYLDGLRTWSLEAVRSKRAVASEVEGDLSYLHHILLARLDRVTGEEARRGDWPADATTTSRHPRVAGEPPSLTDTHAAGRDYETEMEAVLPASKLESLSNLRVEELRQCADRLKDLDGEISSRRRAVLAVVDRLSDEIARRFRIDGSSG